MSKYSSCSLSDVKDLLRKKGARLAGRKADLIERLESYDRNSDFGEGLQSCKYEINLPPPSRVAGMGTVGNEQSKADILNFLKDRDNGIPVMTVNLQL